MRIQHVCAECRRVLGVIEVSGGGLPFGMSGLLGGRTLCPHCGGQVYPVADGETLPPPWRPTAGRMAAAAARAASAWAVFWVIVSFFLVQMPDPLPEDDGKRALQVAFWRFAGGNAAVAAAVGALLVLAVVGLARTCERINAPHPAGLMNEDQTWLMLRVLVVGVLLSVFIGVGVAPRFTPDGLALRSESVRALIAAVPGLLGASLAHMVAFRHCRERDE